MDRMFTIIIRDYDPGYDPDRLTAARIERAVDSLVVNDGSDGTVIVTETTGKDSQ